MTKPKTPNDDFPIHVDGSCLTDSTDLHLPPKRSLSDQTVIHDEDHDEKHQHDEHTEALIQAAARAIVTSIEQDAYDNNAGSSISDLSYSGVDGTENSYSEGTELTYGEETELSYGGGTEMSYEGATETSYEGGTEMSYEGDQESQYSADVPDDPYDGSASSHHEDDVFSHGRRSSGGSLNSSDEQHTDEEARYQLTKGEQNDEQEEDVYAAHENIQTDELDTEQEDTHNTMSRTPSCSSNAYSVLPEALSLTTYTPSKVLNRPPFRTPSSVRAIQMSSPTPSIFSGSPTSRKRVSVSRLGTPTNIEPSTKTPTKFKAKKENPLVLLHVTVLPLQWQHAEIIETAPTELLSKDLLAVRESWMLLREKLGDTVLERGVLLPHPQDSYETLEERLCAVLELPMRPRAKILACGHYVGPSTSFSDSEPSSSDCSDSDDLGSAQESSKRSLWCDVCCRGVRFGKHDALAGQRKKSFKVKVFASNGLMGAGAWGACWREMERVDVEIQPLVDVAFGKEIAELIDATMAHVAPDEVVLAEEAHHDVQENLQYDVQENLHHDFQENFHHDVQESLHHDAQEAFPPAITATPEEVRHIDLNDEFRRREMGDKRLREIYGDETHHETEQPPQPRHDRNTSRRPTTRNHQDDSFLSLLVAAAKVLVQDKKNVLIFLLSLVVVLLAVNPGKASPIGFHMQELAMQKLQDQPMAHEPIVEIAEPVVQKVVSVESPKMQCPEPIRMQAPAQIEVARVAEDQDNCKVPIPKRTTEGVVPACEKVARIEVEDQGNCRVSIPKRTTENVVPSCEKDVVSVCEKVARIEPGKADEDTGNYEAPVPKCQTQDALPAKKKVTQIKPRVVEDEVINQQVPIPKLPVQNVVVPAIAQEALIDPVIATKEQENHEVSIPQQPTEDVALASEEAAQIQLAPQAVDDQVDHEVPSPQQPTEDAALASEEAAQSQLESQAVDDQIDHEVPSPQQPTEDVVPATAEGDMVEPAKRTPPMLSAEPAEEPAISLVVIEAETESAMPVMPAESVEQFPLAAAVVPEQDTDVVKPVMAAESVEQLPLAVADVPELDTDVAKPVIQAESFGPVEPVDFAATALETEETPATIQPVVETDIETEIEAEV